MAARNVKIGDLVCCWWEAVGRWHLARIRNIYPDGSYRVRFVGQFRGGAFTLVEIPDDFIPYDPNKHLIRDPNSGNEFAGHVWNLESIPPYWRFEPEATSETLY